MGSVVYTIGHTYVAPLILLIAWMALPMPVLLWIACIWTAHIGFDRALGYGLSDPSGFKHTHLQRV